MVGFIVSLVVIFIIIIASVSKSVRPHNNGDYGKYADLYDKYLKAGTAAFEKTRFAGIAHRELPPLLFVIGDMGTKLSEQGKKEFLSQVVPPSLPYGEKERGKEELDKRINLYQRAMNGMKIWGCWSTQSVPEWMLTNPVNRATAAFGDVIMTTDCLDDYEYCPVPLYDIIDTLTMKTIMYRDFMPLMVEYVRELESL